MFLAINNYKKSVDNLNVSEAINNIFAFVSDVNKYITDTSPWNLDKNKKQEELRSVISHLAHFIFVISILISPVLTEKSKIILDQLGVPEKLRKIEFIDKLGILDNLDIKRGDLLFNFKSREAFEYLNSKC